MTGLSRFLPIAVLVVCGAALYPLQSWVDRNTRVVAVDEEVLYFANGERLKQISLGYDALLADIYWMRAIQYFGSKVLENADVLDDNANQLKLLYPLLDVTTTLDPHYIEPYRFGGYFVHDYVDKELGRELLKKGVRNNPDNYRLVQDLAFLEWSDGNCEAASDLYARAARIPGAPAWMQGLSATILADCGQVDVTISMLKNMYESTDDPRIREDLRSRIVSFEALAQIEYLQRTVSQIHSQTGQRPASLAAVMRQLQAQRDPQAPAFTLGPNGAPVGPDGYPYAYEPNTGTVGLDPRSDIVLPERVMRGTATKPPAG